MSKASRGNSCQLPPHGRCHHVDADEIHAVRHEVTRHLVATQTRHVRNDLLPKPIELDLRSARGPEEDHCPAPERQCDVHRERIPCDDHVAARRERGKVAHRVGAARIDDGHDRIALKPCISVPFGRPTQQHELRAYLTAKSCHQLEKAIFSPLLQLPPPSGSRVQPHNRTGEIDAEKIGRAHV